MPKFEPGDYAFLESAQSTLVRIVRVSPKTSVGRILYAIRLLEGPAEGRIVCASELELAEVE
jgi:hypothetical protein